MNKQIPARTVIQLRIDPGLKEAVEREAERRGTQVGPMIRAYLQRVTGYKEERNGRS